MKLVHTIAMLSCVGAVALGATSCKVSDCTETGPDGGVVKKEGCVQLQTTIEYRDARMRPGGMAWTSGRPISITNKNGPTTVALGNAGDERVAFLGTAFTRETDDAAGAQKAKDRLAATPDPSFDSGFISLTAPGVGFDGYDLKVWIPPDFDDVITVTTENGTTTFYGAAGAKTTTINSHEIKAYDLRGLIKLNSEIGDIEARGIPSGKGNVIHADLGKINTYLGAANLSITATTKSGAVTFPSNWSQNVNADKLSGSATLGDGTGDLTVTSDSGAIDFGSL
jgi:hypothetical protein